MFTIIAAVGRNRELGKNGGLVFRLPNDLKFFKKVTFGAKILMGRKTFESLPKKLPERKHLVLSSSNFAVDKDVEIVQSLDDFVKKNKDTMEEIFVIGGGSVYAQLLPHAKKMYLTEVDGEDVRADVFFPKFDKSEWLKKIIGQGEDNGVAYRHVLYRRK
ncbi:MAG: dihydrofolate reductase [Candidatus Nomurabacteria bacterium]|jgi:dihydrofolate reductase|nr:dihydrofolate reductase [Candidatus Nomurabacteria bacterium]